MKLQVFSAEHYGRAIPIATEDSRVPGVPFMLVVGANSGPVMYRAEAHRSVRPLFMCLLPPIRTGPAASPARRRLPGRKQAATAFPLWRRLDKPSAHALLGLSLCCLYTFWPFRVSTATPVCRPQLSPPFPGSQRQWMKIADPIAQVGGFNHSYSEKGEPGIGFETEISLRLWLEGWQPGIMDCGKFKRGVGGHGALMSEEKKQARKRVWAANQEKMARSFPLESRQAIAKQV